MISSISSPTSTMHKILMYIDHHLDETIKVQDLCRLFYISESSLRHHFKRTTGKGIVDYILLQKIELAKKLLCKGVKPQQTANQLGFYDYSHFYKIFKRETHLSPKFYQQSASTQLQLPL